MDRANMTIRFHRGDLPDLQHYSQSAAIDTETLGLKPGRDRLCLVQLSPGDGSADIVQVARGQKAAPNLTRLLADPSILKIFHFGRFDIAVLTCRFRRSRRASLLHEDRLAAGAHLHRPARFEGSG